MLKYHALLLKVSQQSNPGFPKKKPSSGPGIPENPSGIRNTGSVNRTPLIPNPYPGTGLCRFPVSRVPVSRVPVSRVPEGFSGNPGIFFRESRNFFPGIRESIFPFFILSFCYKLHSIYHFFEKLVLILRY